MVYTPGVQQQMAIDKGLVCVVSVLKIAYNKQQRLEMSTMHVHLVHPQDGTDSKVVPDTDKSYYQKKKNVNEDLS